MKYIITESKINKLVSTYLDERDLDTSDIGNGEFNIITQVIGWKISPLLFLLTIMNGN